MGARISPPSKRKRKFWGIVFPHWSALACVSSKRRSITGLQTCLQGTARHGKRAAYRNGLTRHGGDMWGVGAMRPLVRILWLLVTTTICIVVIVIHNTSSFDDLVSELLHKNQVIRKKRWFMFPMSLHFQRTGLCCAVNRFLIQINILSIWPQDWMTVLGTSSLLMTVRILFIARHNVWRIWNIMPQLQNFGQYFKYLLFKIFVILSQCVHTVSWTTERISGL